MTPEQRNIYEARWSKEGRERTARRLFDQNQSTTTLDDCRWLVTQAWNEVYASYRTSARPWKVHGRIHRKVR